MMVPTWGGQCGGSVGGLLSEDHDAVPGVALACEWKPTRPHSLWCLVNTPL